MLDTTDPAAIARLGVELAPERTLHIAASKSGTTLETRSHLAWAWDRHPDPARFAVITDPGSELAALAGERGFAAVFENPPGHRRALLGPVAVRAGAGDPGRCRRRRVAGVGLGHHRGAADAAGGQPGSPAGRDHGGRGPGGPGQADARGSRSPRHVRAVARAAPGRVDRQGRHRHRPRGRRAPGHPAVYGEDRLFVAVGEPGPETAGRLDALAAAGHPVARPGRRRGVRRPGGAGPAVGVCDRPGGSAARYPPVRPAGRGRGQGRHQPGPGRGTTRPPTEPADRAAGPGGRR